MNYSSLTDLYQVQLDTNTRPVASRPAQRPAQRPAPSPSPSPVARSTIPIPLYEPITPDPYFYERQMQSEMDRSQIVMRGTNPIRGGMYTASYPNACSQYGSSNVHISPAEFYAGTEWCEVGILMNEHTYHLNNICTLEAQFVGNSWAFRVRDPMTNIFIYLDTVGYGPYGAYRTNDMIEIPGKDGLWKVRIQIQNTPYILYVP